MLTNQEGSAPHALRVLRCAKTLRQVEAAWRLVYDVYLSQGIIDRNPHGIHATPPAVSPNSCTVYGESHGHVVSSLTMIRDSGRGLPLDKVMGDKLDALRSAGRRLVETGMLADRRVQPRRSFRTLFELMRWAFYFTLYEDADDIVVGVHPRHVGFYRRAFMVDVMSETRRYPDMRGKPVVLLRCRARDYLLNEDVPRRGMQFAALNPLDSRMLEHRYRFPWHEVRASRWASALRNGSAIPAPAPNPGLTFGPLRPALASGTTN